MNLTSAELPNKKPNMVPIDQDTTLRLIIKIGPKIDTTHYMPASIELLLKPFFDVLCGIFEICYLTLCHLVVDVLCDLQRVIFHLD